MWKTSNFSVGNPIDKMRLGKMQKRFSTSLVEMSARFVSDNRVCFFRYRLEKYVLLW